MNTLEPINTVEFHVSNPEEANAVKLLQDRDYLVYKKHCGPAVVRTLDLSDITTERLKRVAENFASTKSDVMTFFKYPPMLAVMPSDLEPRTATATFTKNEILDELEARQFRQELRD